MTVVKTKDVRKYIEAYHKEIVRKAEEPLGDDAKDLEAYKLANMNYRIMVSTSVDSGGVCIEYDNNFTSITEEYSSKPLAAMLVKPVLRMDQTGVILNVENNRNVSVLMSILEGALPFRVDKNSFLTLRDVTIVCGGVNKKVYYAEIEGSRDASLWTEVNAIRRASDVLLQAVTDKNKALSKGLTLHEYIASYKARTVLLLGSYDQLGRERLSKIRASLENAYNVIVIDDIPDDPNHTLPQKVSLVGNLCKFVVVDDSSPSGHLQEIGLAKQLDWTTILMHENGRRATFMNADFALTSSNFHEINYTTSDIEEKIRSATAWAEDYLKNRRDQLKDIYPWRRD